MRDALLGCVLLLVSCRPVLHADAQEMGSAGEGGGTAGPVQGGAAGAQGGTAGGTGGDGEGGDPGMPSDAAPELIGAPLPFAPTANGFDLHAVVAEPTSWDFEAHVRLPGSPRWTVYPASAIEDDTVWWSIRELMPGTRYAYDIVATQSDEAVLLDSGELVTQRPLGQPFSFAIITDSHIAPRAITLDSAPATSVESTLAQVASRVAMDHPDFIVNLGDMLDFHQFGFNAPPPDGSWTRLGYLTYRFLLGDTLGSAFHFPVIGNWDGESGYYTEQEINRSREARFAYLPGPGEETYPQGGSPFGDYYAFRWGDALFVVLNVMSYTPTAHLLEGIGEANDDWTLGEEQLDWFEATLEAATETWRFVLIHHTVGGMAGDIANSAYGRGGGQAAYVGEQAIVHQLMRDHGVQIFFYGHDHVFTDRVVDGIHYTLPGSAGAPWKFTTADTGYTEYWEDSGHGRVSVSPTEVTVDFVSVTGDILHSYGLEPSASH